MIILDHIGINSTDATTAILLGNPDRIRAVSAHFAQPEHLTSRRGYIIERVVCGQMPILLVATGIGGPSTAIGVEELIDIGINKLIRLGTCGAIQPHIAVGDLVISTGAVRHDGTSRQYIDVAFPAVPHYQLLTEFVRITAEQAHPVHIGLTHCKDAYYLEKADKQVHQPATKDYWTQLRRGGILATEMELATLFILGQLRRVKTAGILINIGRETPIDVFDRALDASIEIIRKLILDFQDDGQPPKVTPSTPQTSFLDKESYL